MKNVFIIAFLLLNNLFAQDIANANVSVVSYENDPIPGTQIQFVERDSKKVYTGISNEQGQFSIALPPGMYTIKFKSVGQGKDHSEIEIPKLAENEAYGEVSIIIHYEEETSFTLSNLHFETAKSIIKPSSYKELDELVEYLSLKPQIRIEVGGHTDSDGSESDNLKLSRDRAEAVRNYLIKKGIDPNRITAKGYGESQPVADNATEEGKALNRRTEILILE